MSTPEKKTAILIQTAFLGDLLLSIPLMKKMSETHEVSLICRKGLGSFFQSLGLVHQVFEVQKSDAKSYDRVRQSFSQSVDLLVCPHMSFRSAWLAFQLPAKKKISFQTWWNFWAFDQRRKKRMGLPDALRQLDLASLWDDQILKKIDAYENHSSVEEKQYGPVPEWASMQVVEYQPKVTRGQKTVAIFPGSVWPTKRWTLDGFTELANKFLESGYQVVLMGGKEEVDLGQQIQNKYPQVKSVIGQYSLLESLQFLQTVDLVISNDSGSQHLAAAAGTPTVSIFGPTVLSQGFRPWNSKVRIVENVGLFCRPCGKHGHKKCPRGTHECMTKISAGQVFQAAQKL